MKHILPLAALAGMLAGTQVTAHHSFAAEYDGNQPVTVTGTVAKIDWTNPHMHFYVDVKDAAGAVTQWKFEGCPPNMLVRQGWTRNVTLKPGDTVTVSGWKARIALVQAGRRGQTTVLPVAPRHRRPDGSLLPLRCSADHDTAAPVSDHSDEGSGPDPLRSPPRVPHHPHRRAEASR